MKHLVMLMLLAAGATACGTKHSQGPSDAPAGPQAPAANTPVVVGTWSISCLADSNPSLPAMKASTETYTFQPDGTFSDVYTIYEDAACTKGLVKAAFSGRYDVGAAAAAPAGAFDIDFTAQTLHEDLLDATQKVPSACPALQSAPLTSGTQTACNLTDGYQIVKVDGTNLYAGDTNATAGLDASAPDTRPTTLGTVPFVKAN